MHFAVLGLKQMYLLPFLYKEEQRLYSHNFNGPALILDRLLSTCHYSQKIRDKAARPHSEVQCDLAS